MWLAITMGVAKCKILDLTVLQKDRKFWKMTVNPCQLGLILICTENQFSKCLEQITQRVLNFSVIRL